MNMLSTAGCLALSIAVNFCPLPATAGSTIIHRLAQLDAPFHIESRDAQAIQKICDYVRPMKPGARRLLRRMDDFFPIIEQRLKEKGMPDFLKYIPVAESRLSLTVVSPHGAAGLWQLMPNTARSYGLEVSADKDERLDPERATSAALNFLEDLYYEFGDWQLALAAYNCGSGKVKKAIRRLKCRNYHEIKSLLPKQTRQYLPSLVAAAYLDQYYRIVKFAPDEALIPVVACQEKYLSKMPVNFFKKMPIVVVGPLNEPGFPPYKPWFFAVAALVQTRPEQRLNEFADQRA